VSGETESQISGWTTDTLKEYLESRIGQNDLRYQQRFESQEANLVTAITAQEKAVSAALAAAEKAVGKAEVAAEKRFDAVNEFRGQLSDQAREFIPRKEAELQIDALINRVGVLEKSTSGSTGDRDGAARTLTLTFSAVLVLVAIAEAVALVLKH
jgi:hypothetical protein